MSSPIDIGVDLSWSDEELGKTYRNLEAAAVAGGVQAVLDIPNTHNDAFSIDENTNGNVSAKLAAAEKIDAVRIGAYACMNRSYFQFYNLDRLMQQSSGLYVSFDSKLEYNYKYSRRAVDEWVDRAAETGIHSPIIIQNLGKYGHDAVEYVAERGHYVHMGPIATEQEVEWAEYFKRKYGDNFSSSVGLNHLIMTSDDVDRYGSNARLDPPLGSVRDRNTLIDAYAGGVIDVLQSCHKPMPMTDKVFMERDYSSGYGSKTEYMSRSGVSCLEYMVPLMIGKVLKGEVSRSRLEDSWNTQPKRMLGADETEMNRRIDVEIEPRFVESYEIKPDAWNVPYVHWRMPASVIGFTD